MTFLPAILAELTLIQRLTDALVASLLLWGIVLLAVLSIEAVRRTMRSSSVDAPRELQKTLDGVARAFAPEGSATTQATPPPAAVTSAPVAPVAPVTAPAPAPSPAPVVVPKAPEPVVDAKLIAILTAAAMAAVGRAVVVRRVTFINRRTISGWAEAGRSDIHTSHQVRGKV
jgi:hypothetical protein